MVETSLQREKQYNNGSHASTFTLPGTKTNDQTHSTFVKKETLRLALQFISEYISEPWLERLSAEYNMTAKDINASKPLQISQNENNNEENELSSSKKQCTRQSDDDELMLDIANEENVQSSHSINHKAHSSTTPSKKGI